MKNASSSARELGHAERAVYELIRIGHLTPHMAPLYRRELSHLAAANLITRTPDGLFEAPAVLVDGSRPPSVPPPPPPKPILENLNIRVPVEIKEGLDLLADEGETRSTVARRLLAEAIRAALDARTRPEPRRAPSGTRPVAPEATRAAR